MFKSLTGQSAICVALGIGLGYLAARGGLPLSQRRTGGPPRRRQTTRQTFAPTGT